MYIFFKESLEPIPFSLEVLLCHHHSSITHSLHIHIHSKFSTLILYVRISRLMYTFYWLKIIHNRAWSRLRFCFTPGAHFFFFIYLRFSNRSSPHNQLINFSLNYPQLGFRITQRDSGLDSRASQRDSYILGANLSNIQSG